MTFLEEISAIMEQETEILKKLIESAKLKSEILLSGEAKELEKITEGEERLTNGLKAQEKLREEALSARGLSKEMTLLEISEKTGDENPAFVFVAQELIETLGELITLNERNKVLLEDNLAWTEFNINLLSDAQISTGYNKEKSENKQGNRIFDKKV